MLVSLKFYSNGLGNGPGYEHVISICPHISSKGSPVQYWIVNGGLPQSQSIEYSLENLEWCCGGTLFMYNQGLCICTWYPMNKKYPEGDKKKYRNEVELNKSGLTICLEIYHSFDIFHPVGDMNIARTPKHTKILLLRMLLS